MIVEQTPRTTGGGISTGTGGSNTQWLLVAVMVVAVTAVLPYLVVLGSPLHLDDQFVLAWAGWLKGVSPSQHSQFFNWTGPDRMDAWGPLTNLSMVITCGLSGGSAFFLRSISVLIHCVNAIGVFFLFRQLPTKSQPWLPFVSALLFALYPLHPEAVSWVSGRASELSTLWALLVLYSYSKARTSHGASGFKWLAAAVTSLLLACSTTWTMWVLVPMVVAYELINRLNKSTSSDTKVSAVKGIAALFIAAGLYFGTALAISPAVVHLPNPQLSIDNLIQLTRNLIFPINQSVWKGYSLQYRFLYFVLAVPLALLPITLIQDRKLRANLLLMLVWLFCAITPFVGYATAGTDLYGSRWLYFASVPLCGLMAAFLLSVTGISKKYAWAGRAIAIPLIVFLSVLFFLYTKNQNDAYRAAENALKHIQKSVQIVFAKQQAPVILVRDVPAYATVMPQSLNSHLMCFDGATGLLRATAVADGRLKDALRSGHLLSETFRWDKDFDSLVPIDLTPGHNEFGPDISAGKLVDRIHPNIAVYKTLCYDNKQDVLILERNSENGPVLSLRGQGLSPIDGDFFYVDALINAPDSHQDANIELYWVTGVFKDYAHNERKTTTRAILNDKQFHRYYLPIRSIPWITSGPPTLVTLGFPAGAKVQIKGVGIANAAKLVPELTVVNRVIADQSKHFDQMIFDYPESPELGLLTISKANPEAKLHYSLSNVSGATGGFFEISARDTLFDNPNGQPRSGAGYPEPTKRVPINNLVGNYIVSTEQFPQPGLYSIRLIAVDKNGAAAGNFSDSVNFLVRGSSQR